MSNDCSGTMRIVSPKKETIERILKILNYEDDEYCIYRCKYASLVDGIDYDEGSKLFVADIDVDGAWDCAPFFNHGDTPEKHLMGYATNEDGTMDYNTEIEKSAHFTDLCHLAKVLDFGCELWAYEGGERFEQHITAYNNGEWLEERGEYLLDYPENEDGEEDYDKELEEYHELDGHGEFCDARNIYGDCE